MGITIALRGSRRGAWESSAGGPSPEGSLRQEVFFEVDMPSTLSLPVDRELSYAYVEIHFQHTAILKCQVVFSKFSFAQLLVISCQIQHKLESPQSAIPKLLESVNAAQTETPSLDANDSVRPAPLIPHHVTHQAP